MSVTRLLRRQVPVLVVALVCLGACGQADEAATAGGSPSSRVSPSATASEGTSPSAEAPTDAPACEQVWRDGERLARGYRGCLEQGTFVPRDVMACSSGQRLVRYADRWYAVLGGTVHEATTPLERDRDYVADARSCRG